LRKCSVRKRMQTLAWCFMLSSCRETTKGSSSRPTDVLVLLAYYWGKDALAQEVYMHAGHSRKCVTRERFIPVHHISTKLGKAVCKCLPAMHALSGCDTTSALYKLGKRTAYSTSTNNVEALQKLETFQDVPTFFLDTARRFILLMHGKKAKRSVH